MQQRAVEKVSATQRPAPIVAITRFGAVMPRKSQFDSFTLGEVRKVIMRAQTFDNRNVGGTLMPGGVFTSVYIPGTQVSVSSMDSAAMTRQPLANYIAVSRAFLAGDHWQGGSGWVGPWPKSGTDPNVLSTAANDIAQRFVSHNVLGEIVDRHVTGVVGREPAWGLAPQRVVTDDAPITEAEQRLINEANDALTLWWDTRRAHELLQSAIETLLFARRATIRIYIPAGQLRDVRSDDEQGNSQTRKMVIVSNFTEALMTLWADHPAPEIATVARDDATKDECGAVLYQGGISITGEGQPVETGELTYIDPPSQFTVLRTLDKDVDVEWSADLGGRLLMHEMDRKLFLTPQLQQKQRALNLALSMLPRHLVTAGFLERILLNAQMPGKWIKDPVTGDERGIWVPDPVTAGPGVVSFFQGVEQEDSQGNITRASPEVHDRLPVSPEPTLSAIRAAYELMLEEADQAHVLMNADAGASGLSREQARADYERSLTTTAPRVERLGRWLIETLLATAEALTGQPGKYTKVLRAVFTCRLDTGPVDSLERTANDASYKNGTLSREGAMSRNGIADVDAESALIDAQPGAELQLIERMQAVFSALLQDGLDVESAATIAGFSPEQIKVIQKGFTEPAPPPPPPGDGTGGDGGGDGGGAPPVAQ